jgi:tetratricopeptide (TPR) repeat protein
LIIRSRGAAYRSKSYEDALGWLATQSEGWFLILDNADNPNVDIFHFIPKNSRGNIVITTRDSTYQTLAPTTSLKVEGLSPSDASTLLLRLALYEDNDKNRAIADRIAETLGHLPLALAHAGGYISVHHCLSTYLDMYHKSQAKFLASRQVLPEDYRQSVATTIQMSLEHLSQSARGVMILFSRLDVTSIAHSVVQRAAERQFRRAAVLEAEVEEMEPHLSIIEHAKALMDIFCPSGEWLESEFNDLILQCLRHSLLQVTTKEEAKFYSMHVLVQSYLQSSANDLSSYQPDHLAIRFLSAALTIDFHQRYWSFDRLLIPHMKLVQIVNVEDGIDQYYFGTTFLDQGNILLSVQYLERSLELCKTLFDEEHLNTAVVMADLSASYSMIGRHEEALKLSERGLELRMKRYGEEHPFTINIMGDLAVSLSDVGRRQEALELTERVLELKTKLLGAKDPSTVLTMANLAVSYNNEGRHREALNLAEQVLEMRMQIYGDEHPWTLLAMRILSGVMYMLGMQERALKLLLDALPLHEKVLGQDDRDTAYVRQMIEYFWSTTTRKTSSTFVYQS